MAEIIDAKSIPLNKLAKMYIKIRAAEQALLQQFEPKMEELKEQKQMVALAMKDQLLALKAKSVKTEAGLVILSEKTRYYPSDWGALSEWIKQNDALEVLEQRVHQGNMKQYIEENPEDIPPGLNIDTKYEISVRKP